MSTNEPADVHLLSIKYRRLAGELKAVRSRDARRRELHRLLGELEAERTADMVIFGLRRAMGAAAGLLPRGL